MRVDRDEPLPDPRDADFAVALGSGATATGSGPEWVEREIEWLRAADAAALPVLGICFGAQALAAALGGCVHRARTPELGWVTVETADAEHVPAGPWMAWHEDRFTLPPLAYELASQRVRRPGLLPLPPPRGPVPPRGHARDRPRLGRQ